MVIKTVVVAVLILSTAAFLVLRLNPCWSCRSEIWDETLDDAAQRRFNYCGAFHAALDGDPDALQHLFEFGKKTDAASALGHGAALVKILQGIGDARFAERIRGQPVETRGLVGHLIEAGIDYGLGKHPDQMPALFPLSHQAAFEGSMER
jgi:hypothetical protein